MDLNCNDRRARKQKATRTRALIMPGRQQTFFQDGMLSMARLVNYADWQRNYSSFYTSPSCGMSSPTAGRSMTLRPE